MRDLQATTRSEQHEMTPTTLKRRSLIAGVAALTAGLLAKQTAQPVAASAAMLVANTTTVVDNPVAGQTTLTGTALNGQTIFVADGHASTGNVNGIYGNASGTGTGLYGTGGVGGGAGVLGLGGGGSFSGSSLGAGIYGAGGNNSGPGVIGIGGVATSQFNAGTGVIGVVHGAAVPVVGSITPCRGLRNGEG